MSGWIKLHRNISDWEWYTDANTCRLFIHCLIKANHTGKKWRGYAIQRGQFISSFEGLGAELKLSRQEIRTGIRKLSSTNDISTSSKAQHTVFTVENYDRYQDISSEQPPEQPQPQPTSNQPATTTKNDKNDKKKEVKDSSSKKFKYESLDLEAAQNMYNRILVVAPHAQKPNLEDWANTIRLMRESENLTMSDIWKVFVWANHDDFWSVNILSPKKLRKQFAQLQAKMSKPTTGNGQYLNSHERAVQQTDEAIKSFLSDEDPDDEPHPTLPGL